MPTMSADYYRTPIHPGATSCPSRNGRHHGSDCGLQVFRHRHEIPDRWPWYEHININGRCPRCHYGLSNGTTAEQVQALVAPLLAEGVVV